MSQDNNTQYHSGMLPDFLKKYQTKLSKDDFNAINFIATKLIKKGVDIQNVGSMQELLSLAQSHLKGLNDIKEQDQKILNVGDIFLAKENLLLRPMSYVCHDMPITKKIVCGINRNDIFIVWKWIVSDVLNDEEKKDFDDLISDSKDQQELRDSINIIQKSIANSLKKYCDEADNEPRNNRIFQRFNEEKFIDYVRLMHDCFLNSNAIEFIYTRFRILKKNHKTFNKFLCLDCFRICDDMLESYMYLGIILLYRFFPEPQIIIQVACECKLVIDSEALDKTDYAICLKAAFFQAYVMQNELEKMLKKQEQDIHILKQKLHFYYHYIFDLSHSLGVKKNSQYRVNILELREGFSGIFDNALQELMLSLPIVLENKTSFNEEKQSVFSNVMCNFTLVRESRLFADQLLINLKLQQGYEKCRNDVENKKDDLLLKLRSRKHFAKDIKTFSKRLSQIMGIFLNEQNVRDFNYEIDVISKRQMRQAFYG